MTIVTLGSKYFIPVENGFKEIPFSLAMELIDKGEVSHMEDLEFD